MKTQGWLFDLYPAKRGMVLWWITEAGERLRLETPFTPAFYAEGKARDLRPLIAELERKPSIAGLEFVKRWDLVSEDRVEVLKIALADPSQYPVLPERLFLEHPRVLFWNCGIHPAQLYCYERQLFPLAFCRIEHDGGVLRGVECLDDPWALEYALPPLRIMEIRGTGPVGRFSRRLTALRVTVEGERYDLSDGSEAELLETFKDLLAQYDPDLIYTEEGDAFLLPLLLALAKRHRVDLPLDREPVVRRPPKEGRSFFSYGRVIYMTPPFLLHGRWHIDLCNSFIYHDGELPGLLEVCRVAKVPVQRQARLSTGVAITSMQMDEATRMGALIPWKKAEVEEAKTLAELITIDKGGMVYLPPMGLHENVAEIDFASMYPSLMVAYNISSETVNCDCCPKGTVPEAGYSLCQRREGLVPRVLRPLLEKRLRYKNLKKASQGEAQRRYDLLQSALRWCLLVSFGYLGYRNARWGQIMAHEAVTSLGREMLLRARTIAEASGFQVIHAVVDSVYVQKPDLTEAELGALCREIEDATKIPIALEGIYRWIVFCPSRESPEITVPNRFYGVFQSGDQKVRGLELRRHDTAPRIARAQQAMLDCLARAENATEFMARVPEALELLRRHVDEIREGRVPFEELVITRTLSKDPMQYVREDAGAIAAKAMAGAGVKLHPGEQIGYIILDRKARVKGERARPAVLLTGNESYDKERYVELLLRAAETLLAPVGYPAARLQSWLDTS
ncbi:MAG: DNA polymerase domain-containing protein [Candidatus Methylomirabilales bacterium]